MRCALLLAAMLAWLPVVAQDESAAEGAAEQQQAPRPLPDEAAAELQERIDEIASQKEHVDDLLDNIEEAQGLLQDVYARRMDEVWSSMFDNALDLARDIARYRDQGYEVGSAIDAVRRDLEVFPDEAMEAMQRLQQNIVYPSEDLSPRELILVDQAMLAAMKDYDSILRSLVTFTQIAEAMELDATPQINFLLDRLPDAAANRSAYLKITIDNVTIARSASATLPQDEELPQRVLVAEARVATASTALQQIVDLMNEMGLDTREYRKQLLTATGELTTDVLDVSVVKGLLADWSAAIYEVIETEGPKALFSLLLFVLIVWVGSRLGRLTKSLTTRAIGAAHVNLSQLLKDMIVSAAGNLVFLFAILIALSQLGVSLGPLLAGLGIAGFILGFALQDSLSNFASGMMILVYRPFDVGDYVEAGGVEGRVDRMSLVNTTFKTFDNQVLVVPNNLIWQTVIKNLTAQTTRRVDLTFGIAYEDDIDKAKSILRDIVDNHPAVLDDPEPNIRVHSLGESSVDLILRPWVKTDDYWDTYWDLTEIVKKRFDEEGITIPFPQRTVHQAPD
ncbi:MAG: mechanosensitive ion channel family protein [Woeseiaceae bacterium]|nr:mechanosensitive ion channel family protein [Woeseiaceae bacterium]